MVSNTTVTVQVLDEPIIGTVLAYPPSVWVITSNRTCHPESSALWASNTGEARSALYSQDSNKVKPTLQVSKNHTLLGPLVGKVNQASQCIPNLTIVIWVLHCSWPFCRFLARSHWLQQPDNVLWLGFVKCRISEVTYTWCRGWFATANNLNSNGEVGNSDIYKS